MLVRKLVMVTCLVLLPVTALAHEYRSSGPIQVLLHIDPNDDPSTHQASKLNVFITDANNQFVGSQCDCRLTVKLNNKTLLDHRITVHDSGSLHQGEVPFSFPDLGVYTITFSAKPQGSAQFQPFTLNFSQRVSTLGYEQRKTNDFLYIGAAVVIGAALGRTLWRFRPQRTT